MRVLVTGASGLLGANLVLGWSERHEVIGISHNVKLTHPRLDLRQADLAVAGVARRLFQEVRPEAVVHCAAATDVEVCERDSALAAHLNVEMSQAVAAAAADTGARLIHISTDAVFDGRGGPYREDDVAAPVNEYGRSKLAGEAAALAAHPAALVVRTNFFGWNAEPKVNLAEWFLARLRSGAEAPGFTDVLWAPIVVNDLADILEVLLGMDAHGVLHVPGRDCLSKFEFGRRLARAFGMDENRVTASDSSRAGFQAPRPRRTCLDGGNARAILRKDLPDLDEGLRLFERLARNGYVERLRGLAGS